MIRALPAEYKGLQFRSRLEARWAIFFDLCGYSWTYEPEGLVTYSGEWYLPDFLLHDIECPYGSNVTRNLYVEVKPEARIDELYKAKDFAYSQFAMQSEAARKKFEQAATLEDMEYLFSRLSFRNPLIVVDDIFYHNKEEKLDESIFDDRFYYFQRIENSYKRHKSFYSFNGINGSKGWIAYLGMKHNGKPALFCKRFADSYLLSIGKIQRSDAEKTQNAFRKALKAQFARDGKYRR